MTPWSCESVTVIKEGKTLLDKVSVSLRPGALTAVVGPNGSGKTTLIRVLAGLEVPANGTVARGTSVHWSEPQWAKTVSAVLEQAPDGVPFCVEEILLSAFYPEAQRWLDPSEDLRKILVEILDRLEVFQEGAEEGLNRAYSTLSAGEKQLVDVARGVLQPTPILLLDEPTSALDLRHRLLVRNLLVSEAREKGRTIGLSLHDIGDLDSSYAQIVVLKRGTVVGTGNPESILTPELFSLVWGVVPDGARFRLL